MKISAYFACKDKQIFDKGFYKCIYCVNCSTLYMRDTRRVDTKEPSLGYCFNSFHDVEAGTCLNII